MAKTKIETVEDDALDLILPADPAASEDETPAGVKLSYVRTWVTRLGQIDAELAAVENALEDARTKRKAILKAREEHIHTRPDEQLPNETPLFTGLGEDPPAGCVSVQVNLDRGGAAAVAVLTAASARLSNEDFTAWAREFVDEAEDFV